MRVAALISGFVLAAVVAASQSACVVPFECIYFTIEGYQPCGNLEPVISSDRTGPVEIVGANGQPPGGCTCMHPDTAELFLADAEDPILDPIYEQIEADARVNCEQLAIQLMADPSPCEAATLDEGSVHNSAGTTYKCPFQAGEIDEDKDGNCPPLDGEDEVGFTTDTGTETDTGDEGGVILIHDLPFEAP